MTVVRAHTTWRNPVGKRYIWPRSRATVKYGYCYERDGVQKVWGLSPLDRAPDEYYLSQGWKPIFKIRAKMKTFQV